MSDKLIMEESVHIQKLKQRIKEKQNPVERPVDADPEAEQIDFKKFMENKNG